MPHYTLHFSRNMFRAYRFNRRSTSACLRTCSKKWPTCSKNAQILLPALEAPRQVPQIQLRHHNRRTRPARYAWRSRLLMVLVLTPYFAMREINSELGDGVLFRMLLTPRQDR